AFGDLGALLFGLYCADDTGGDAGGADEGFYSYRPGERGESNGSGPAPCPEGGPHSGGGLSGARAGWAGERFVCGGKYLSSARVGTAFCFGRNQPRLLAVAGSDGFLRDAAHWGQFGGRYFASLDEPAPSSCRMNVALDSAPHSPWRE